MNHQEKIRAGAGEIDSVDERSSDSMAESVRNLLHGIRNSVRGLIRNLPLVTQVSAAALGAIGCGTSPATEELDYPAQCVSKIFPSKPDNTPQCVSTIPAEPQVKEVDVCFMRWSDSYDLTDEIRAKLNAEFDLATQFFDEVTFRRDKYRFNLIDSGTVWAGPSPANRDDDINFGIQACAPQINDFNKVDTFVVFPSFDDLQATGDRKTIHTPQGDMEMGVIRLPHYTKISGTLYPDLKNLRHELGHADLLLNHATEYDCYQDTDDPYRAQLVTYNADPDRCHFKPYGNPYDLMGGGLVLPDGEVHEVIFGQPGGFEKSLNDLVTVTNITENSGEYLLAALEVSCSNVPQLLRISYSDIPLCLDYRLPTGFDAPLSENYINEKLGYKAGLPSDGCVFLQICSNDPTKFGYTTLNEKFNGTSFLLRPNVTLSNGSYPEQRDRLGACIPRGGFCDANLGIDVSYSQSTTNPNVVIVHVSGVGKARLAKLPNLIAGFGTHGSSRILGETAYVENVSENGESVGAFNIQISGKRISDGQFELIETRPVDGLPLFGKVAINFPQDQLKSLKLIYSELRVTADSGNVIEETDEADNEVTYGIASN